MANQLTFLPVTDKFFAKARQDLIDDRWIAQKVLNPTTMEQDKRDLEKMDPGLKRFCQYIAKYFAVGDKIVGDIISKGTENYCMTRQSFEIQKGANEDIHNEVYSETFKLFFPEKDLLDLHFDEIENEFIDKKVKWSIKAVDINKDFALTCIEGIFFSASFCSIYFVKSLNLLPCFSEANEYIARDEGFHTTWNIYAYNKGTRLDEGVAEQLMREAVEIEHFFINSYCPTLTGFNPRMLCDYVESLADFNMEQMGHKKIFGKQNPFPFMSSFGKMTKSDFFNKKPSEYTHYNKTAHVRDLQAKIDEVDAMFR